VNVTVGRSADPADLQALLGVQVDEAVFQRALTHRSYAYEHGGLPTNERLEFLGDSVLGVVVTETLFRRHPDLPEGQLAKLRSSVVNMHALAGVAATLGGPAGLGAALDWKTSLQELSAATGSGVPEYDVLEDGPDHEKVFTATAVIGGERLGHGVGHSKKEAEQQAAAAAWAALRERFPELSAQPELH
jgi:ribonuclease-3